MESKGKMMKAGILCFLFLLSIPGLLLGSKVKVEKKLGATVIKWGGLQILILSNDTLSTALYNGEILYKSIRELSFRTFRNKMLGDIGNALEREPMKIEKKPEGVVVTTSGVIGQGDKEPAGKWNYVKGPGKWNYERVIFFKNNGVMNIKYKIKKISSPQPAVRYMYYMINFPAGYNKKATISVNADSIRVSKKGGGWKWQKIEGLYKGKFGGAFLNVKSCEFSVGDLKWGIKFPGSMEFPEGSYFGKRMGLVNYGYCCSIEIAPVYIYEKVPDVSEISVIYDFSKLIGDTTK